MPELPSLPDDYIRFLGTHDGTTSFNFDGRNSWWLFTKDDLVKEIRVDRRKTVTISQLRSFSESLKDLGADSLEDQDGNPYALERLSDGLAIGSNNGDVMFLDPSDRFSVWVYYLDGSDVERLADSFSGWLAGATIDDAMTNNHGNVV